MLRYTLAERKRNRGYKCDYCKKKFKPGELYEEGAHSTSIACMDCIRDSHKYWRLCESYGVDSPQVKEHVANWEKRAA